MRHLQKLAVVFGVVMLPLAFTLGQKKTEAAALNLTSSSETPVSLDLSWSWDKSAPATSSPSLTSWKVSLDVKASSLSYTVQHIATPHPSEDGGPGSTIPGSFTWSPGSSFTSLSSSPHGLHNDHLDIFYDYPASGNATIQLIARHKIPEPVPVPEPLTILGSATALAVGSALTREHSKRQNKANSKS